MTNLSVASVFVFVNVENRVSLKIFSLLTASVSVCVAVKENPVFPLSITHPRVARYASDKSVVELEAAIDGVEPRADSWASPLFREVVVESRVVDRRPTLDVALSFLALVIFLLVIALVLLDVDLDLVPRPPFVIELLAVLEVVDLDLVLRPPFVIELLADDVDFDLRALRVRVELVARVPLVDVDFVLLLIDLLLPYAIIFFLLVINIYINHFLLSCSLSHLIPARRGL